MVLHKEHLRLPRVSIWGPEIQNLITWFAPWTKILCNRALSTQKALQKCMSDHATAPNHG